MQAVQRAVTKTVFIACIAYAVYAVVQYVKYADDVDPPNGRSGLVHYTDALTGCQYLAVSSMIGGELTPRLEADHRHAGCRH